MSRWFRFYDDALNDKKVQRLAPHLFKTWVNLLCLASKGGGKIPSNDDVAFELRISVQDAQQQTEDLILAGLIDIKPDGSREPHNWSERQFTSDTSVERTRKYRERINKKPCDVTVTPGVTPPESYSYSESEEESNGLLSFPTAAREGAEDRKGNLVLGKKTKDDDRIVKRAAGLGIPTDELIAAVNRHKAKNRPAYFTKLCVEWLQPKLPRLDEQIIRDAIWKTDPKAFTAVSQLLIEAVP